MKRGARGCVLVGLWLVFIFGAQGGPLSHWSWKFPQPQGCNLRAVTYGGSQFVAVGDYGTILTSADGFSWTIANSGTTAQLTGVAYANGLYAAVGYGGIILVSSNATTWTHAPQVTTTNLWAVTGNALWRVNGLPQFLAVGDNGECVAYNGSTWTNLVTGTTNSFYSALWASSQIILVGQAGTMLRLTTSGLSAVPQTVARTNNTLYTVGWDRGSTLVAAGDLTLDPYGPGPYKNYILYSSGSSWDYEYWNIGSDGSNPNLWYLSDFFVLTGMAYGSSGFVAVGYTGYAMEYHPAVVMVSPSGTDWTELSASVSENPLRAVANGNGLYVAVGDFGSIVVSTDARNWTKITPDRRGLVSAIACGTNQSMAVSMPAWYTWGFPDARVLVSTNGGAWNIIGTATNSPVMTDLASDGNLFVGVGARNAYATTDGRNFTTNTVTTNSLMGVRFLQTRFYAVGAQGTILSSSDGSNWVDRTRYSTGYLSGVAYGNGTYVAAGSVCATSQSGLTWNLGPTPLPAPITRLTFGRGLFVAAAAGTNSSSIYPAPGRILTSADGRSWQTQFLEPNNEALSGIVYGAGIFAAITGDSGTVYTSIDGTNWTASGTRIPESPALFMYYNPTFPECYTTLAEHNGTFYVGGGEGMVLQSDPVLFTGSAARLFADAGDSGSLNLRYTQENGVPYRLQASVDMVHWLDLYSGVGSGQSGTSNVPAVPGLPARFFRLVAP